MSNTKAIISMAVVNIVLILALFFTEGDYSLPAVLAIINLLGAINLFAIYKKNKKEKLC